MSGWKEQLATATGKFCDWLEKPVRDGIDKSGKKFAQTRSSKWGRRTSTAVEWGTDTMLNPANAMFKDIAANKPEEMYVDAILALGEQCLKVLEGINNWVKGWDFSKKLDGKETLAGERTTNLPRNGNDGQTTNLPPPNRRNNEQTTNIPPPNRRNDGQTTNIPPAKGNDGQTANIPKSKGKTSGQTLTETTQTLSNASKGLAQKAATAKSAANAAKSANAKVNETTKNLQRAQQKNRTPAPRTPAIRTNVASR